MYSDSVVLKAISVCTLLYHVRGHPAYIITKPFSTGRTLGWYDHHMTSLLRSPIENGIFDNVCRMSPDMVQQATNVNSFEHNRIRVHSSISISERSNTFHEFDGQG